MRIIERTISFSIFRIFFATIFTFCFLYILIDVAANLAEIIDRKVPWEILLKYYSSFFPIIIVQTSTIACLIGVLLTYSQMNSHNELIALRSAGVNFWRISRPAITFALLVSVFVFYLNEHFVPRASVSSEQIRNDNIILKADTERKKKDKIKNLPYYGLKNRLYFFDTFDPNTNEVQGVTIIGQDQQQRMSEKIVALNGKWTGVTWKFFQCQITTFDPNEINKPKEIKYFTEKIMDIKESPQDFLRQRLNVDAMNLQQLHSYIQRFSESGAAKALNNLRVDFHQKIAFPFATLVIVLVGLPLAMLTGRRKAVTFTSLGIAILIGFLYYVFNAVGLAFGKGGFFPPILAAWMAPLVFLMIATYLIQTKF